MGGEVGPLFLESALLLEVAGEYLLEFDTSLGASGAKQLPVELALGLAKGRERCIESPAVGAGDDEVGVEGLEGAAVELVEAPALDTVLEGVLLAMPMPA